MTEEVTQADREASLAEEIRELLEECTNGNPDDDCQEYHLLRRALAHLPTDLSEERAREVLDAFDRWQDVLGGGMVIEPDGEFVTYDEALRAMHQYAAGLQVENAKLRDIAHEAEFLCARIDELDWCDLDETARQHAGHVDPPLARLKGLLTALGGTQ